MTETKPGARIVCAGILVADLFVPPLISLPEPGDLIATDDFLMSSGGCATNTAICLTRLGNSATVIGRVGVDTFGDFVCSDLAKHGVDVRGIKRSEQNGTSKTVVITVVGDDRRFLHTVGANADLEADDLDVSVIAQAAALYVGGYLVLPGLAPAGLATKLEWAQNHGIRTILDVVAPRGEDGSGLELLRPVLPFVDVFMPNETESRALTGVREPSGQAAVFLAAGCKMTIITRGNQGALLATTDTIIEVDAPEVTVADESGAGDAFAAGFITGIVEAWPIHRTVSFASVLGASACTQLGCHEGIFTRSEATKFLQENPVTMRTYPRA